MTRGQLRNLVLSWLNDPDAGYFTIPEVNLWLNNAQKEVQKKLLQAGQNWYLTCAQTQTAINQDCYALPVDFLKVQKFEIVLSGTSPNENTAILLPGTPMEVSGIQGPGTPQRYFFKKDCAVLKPIPTQVWTIRMLYSYLVQDMTNDNEEPDAPTQYHELLACYATKDGFLKDGSDPSQIEKKIAAYLELMAQDAQDRTEDVPRMVRSTEDWNLDYLW